MLWNGLDRNHFDEVPKSTVEIPPWLFYWDGTDFLWGSIGVAPRETYVKNNAV